MAILYANQEELNSELEKNEVVLVDFYADWCGPCKALAPILEEIDNDREKVKIVKINIDRNPDIAKRFGIMSIPTLIVFKNGKEINKNIGLCSKEFILEMIQS